MNPIPEAEPADTLPTLQPDRSNELTLAQRQAVEQLCRGRSIIHAAKVAGVNRRTVHRWLTADPTFRAAYNLWQRDALELSRARLLALADDAVTAVAISVRKGNSRTALAVLKGLTALRPPSPGPTDPDRLLAEAKAAERAAEVRMLENEERAMVGLPLLGEE